MSSQSEIRFNNTSIGFLGYSRDTDDIAVYDSDGNFIGWAANKFHANAILVGRYELSQREDEDGEHYRTDSGDYGDGVTQDAARGSA